MRLIVGVDPGATAGIAVIDANSITRKVETASRRNFSYSDILEWLSEKGEPMIIATDKARVPLLVRKVAAAFGARLVNPPHDLRLAEKKEITSTYNTKTDHEADALAAALFAKAQFSSTLEKVEKSVDAAKQGIVKKLLITGQAANIETALRMIEVRKAQKIGKERHKTRDSLISRLMKELEDARTRNAVLEKGLAELQRAVQKKKYMRNESAVMTQLRKSIADVLGEKNRTIKALEKIIAGEYIIVMAYSDQLTDEEIRGKAIILDYDNDRITRKIENAGAAAIITDFGIVTSLPLVQKRKANIRQAGKFLVVERISLEQDDKQEFVAWLHDYKEKRKTEKIS
ncbi:MAG: DUF460 domain-containing protein [Candidatus Aenigmarchaeota archaeon]|nr:DUF460 domain-containing protein [Candidatus Aenigmarchaeota archaeon]